MERYSVAAHQIRDFQNSPNSPVEPLVTTGSDGMGAPNSSAGLTAAFSLEQYRNNDQELEKMEKEEYIEERSISKSKWADVDSPRTASDTNISSPESGEFNREGSQESRDKSSGSDEGGHFMEPASGDEHYQNELSNDDGMEIDYKIASVSPVDSSSEDDDDFTEVEVPKYRKVNMLRVVEVYLYMKD